MLSNKEYEDLVNLVIKHFKSKKFNEMYLDIIEDIEDLNESETVKIVSAFLCK